MAVTFMNAFGEDRVTPTLGYRLVPAGDTVTVPDEDADNWAAGGWTRIDNTVQTSKTTTPAVAPAPPEGTTD